MAVETANPYLNIATRDNIVRDNNDPLPDAYVEARAREDFDARLTGDFADGRLITDAESDASDTQPAVLTVVQGAADRDEIQFVSLPEDVSGTFTLTVDNAATAQTTTALALDASAAVVQAAVDALSNLADGDVTVTKVAGRRGYGLAWNSDAVDFVNHAVTVATVTETGERGLDNN